MKVVRFHAPGDVSVEDAPEPTPAAGEVKIRVRNCSTCGTDVKIWKFGHHHIVPPRVMGHEVAGEIVGVGEGVVDWRPGERVQVIAAIPCGQCGECRRGRMTVCPNQESIGYHYEGGFAEYMVVPAKVLAVDGLNRIPDEIGFAEASVAEPLACVLNGQLLARVGEGDDVVVMGSGPIGCLHVRLARARRAARVFLVDINPERLHLAAALVAPDAAVSSSETDVVDEIGKLTDGRGADVVITAAASGKAQEQAIQMAARQGRISFFGGLPKDNPVIALRLEPRALPRADDRGRQRIKPRAQRGGPAAHRLECGPGVRSDHPPAPAGPDTGGLRHRRPRRGHQGNHRAVSQGRGTCRHGP